MTGNSQCTTDIYITRDEESHDPTSSKQPNKDRQFLSLSLYLLLHSAVPPLLQVGN